MKRISPNGGLPPKALLAFERRMPSGKRVCFLTPRRRAFSEGGKKGVGLYREVQKLPQNYKVAEAPPLLWKPLWRLPSLCVISWVENVFPQVFPRRLKMGGNEPRAPHTACSQTVKKRGEKCVVDAQDVQMERALGEKFLGENVNTKVIAGKF